MSSSSVCQGLQSCLEPRVMEPRVLRLKLATSSGNASLISFPQDHQEKHECDDKKDTISNVGGSGWSFLQSLTTHTTSSSSSHCNKTEDPQVYVHPTVKRSSSMLSEKSLEMCTESLGSETGSNAGESSTDDISLFSLENSTCFTRHDTATKNCTTVSKRVNRACNFPPPLTSITDFGGVNVKPHRENGRLILEAVPSPSPRPYFHADRSDGRLKLRLLETFSASDCDDDDDVEEEWSYDEEEEEEEEDDDDDEGQNQAELEECVENVEDDEMGVTKFGRPIRCKESGNNMFVDGYFELPSLSLCL